MYCNNCGKEVADNMKFCIHCGQELINQKNVSDIPKSRKHFPSFALVGAVAVILILCIGVTFVLRNNHNTEQDIPHDKQFAADSNPNIDGEKEDTDTGLFKIETGGATWDDTATINNHLSENRKFTDNKNLYCISGNNIYRSKINSNKFEHIEGAVIKADNINLVGELLYFDDDDGICEYNPRTGVKNILLAESPDFMRVYKGYIYYTIESDGRTDDIYRMSIDGSENICLKEDIVGDLTPLTIFEDSIFFVDDENNYINKMSLDGQQTEVFMNEEVDDLAPLYIDNGYMYYEKVVDHFILGSSECRIYRIKMDRTGEQQITTVQSDDYMVHNGKIYYEGYKNWDTDSKVCLCSINIDGTDDEIIENMKYDGYDDFFVAGDYLLYTTTTDIVSGDTTSFQYTNYCLNMSDDTRTILNLE